ncbi:MAG: hypothetical protein WD153_00275 [Candidatus Paceibacterota bacterium]
MRPTIYTKELADRICSRIASGESLRRICKDDDMPSRRVVHLWLFDDSKKEFLHHYKEACDMRTDEMFDEIQEIADDTDGDVMRDRLRVDTRKWQLSKMKPKKYGDKMDLTTAGEPIKGFNYVTPNEPNDHTNQEATPSVDDPQG